MYIVFSRVLLPPLSIHRLVSPFLDSGPDGVDDPCFYPYGEFFHVGHDLAFFFSPMLRYSTPCFVGRSVGPSVRHTLLFFCGLWPHCSCPNDQVTSKTAPAHPHATGVAVYPALFFSMSEFSARFQMGHQNFFLYLSFADDFFKGKC